MIRFQTLAIIFVLIFVPVSLILSYYINSQIDVITIQNSYDTKLLNSTYDAVVAFELNTNNNNGYSSNAEALRRDINASVTTFTTSLAKNFGKPGAGKNSILPYIPAVVYTLYDGYYIYSPMRVTNVGSDPTFEHILKPYVYYTARYYSNSGQNDFVVNYSLDNYIVIYGKVNGNYISEAGYLSMPHKYDSISLSGDASEYLASANDFTNRICNVYGLKSIKVQDIVAKIDDTGRVITAKELTDADKDNSYYEFKNNTGKLFDIRENNKDNDPELKTSVFWDHKSSIIRKSIEENLQDAINNYTAQSEGMGSTYDYKMPILFATEWDKVLSNISIISFLQGLPIGYKTYNNYMIVSSTGNNFMVDPDELYFTTGDSISSYYHRINCPLFAKELNENSTLNIEGHKNIYYKGVVKLEKDENDNIKEFKNYSYNNWSLACYECLIASKVGGIVYDTEEKDTSKTYVLNNKDNLIDFIVESDYASYYTTDVVQKLRNAYYNTLFSERKKLVKVSQYVNGE